MQRTRACARGSPNGFLSTYKWSTVTFKTTTRLVRVLFPTKWGAGCAEGAAGLLLAIGCYLRLSHCAGRWICPFMWPLNGMMEFFWTCDKYELLPRTQVWVWCSHQRRWMRLYEVLLLKGCF
jgi:hypothetical protein